ncbi:hypothetical protein evm_004721 [Chilo suppressalis]|nr:hypothetical protein evm_004721 [Chilo suppressalis]
MFKLVLICSLVFYALTQDCNVGGNRCVDHEQCCGGCCYYGECIDTYRSCLLPLDVCKDHICLGEESCVVYTPPECNGCEPIPICKIL